MEPFIKTFLSKLLMKCPRVKNKVHRTFDILKYGLETTNIYWRFLKLPYTSMVGWSLLRPRILGKGFVGPKSSTFILFGFLSSNALTFLRFFKFILLRYESRNEIVPVTENPMNIPESYNPTMNSISIEKSFSIIVLKMMIPSVPPTEPIIAIAS